MLSYFQLIIQRDDLIRTKTRLIATFNVFLFLARRISIFVRFDLFSLPSNFIFMRGLFNFPHIIFPHTPESDCHAFSSASLGQPLSAKSFILVVVLVVTATVDAYGSPYQCADIEVSAEWLAILNERIAPPRNSWTTNVTDHSSRYLPNAPLT